MVMLGLSRLPLDQGCSVGHYDEPGIFNLNQIESLPVTAKTLRSYTSRDRVLSHICRYLRVGWPQSLDPVFFFNHTSGGERKCLSRKDVCFGV